MNAYSIKMHHTPNLEKSAIIERFHRTLNNKLKTQFDVRNNKKWIDILQELLNEYNFKDKHRSIGMTPSKANKLNEDVVFQTLFKSREKKSIIKFHVGDRVRISSYKYTFSNMYAPNWTREIFVVTEILNTQPVTYKIKALDGEKIIGSFYNEKLQKKQSFKLTKNNMPQSYYFLRKNCRLFFAI